MRQYSLTLLEIRRFWVRMAKAKRKLFWLRWIPGMGIKRVDLTIELQDAELNLRNKLYSIEHFEKCRKKLVQMNGGKAPTNKQYQAEQPAYYKWFLEQKIMQQLNAQNTGIDQGVFNAIDMLGESSVLNEEYVVRNIRVPTNDQEAIAVMRDLFIGKLIKNRNEITKDEEKLIEDMDAAEQAKIEAAIGCPFCKRA